MRDAPSSPCTRHGRRRITGHRRTLRSDNASYSRALDRAHNLTLLVATKSESLPITSRAGNDRNASPGELDFMHGGMTRRHEGCVSTMLTDKRLEYCTAGAPLQWSGATKWMMQADKHGVSGAFRLDNARPARPIASPAARSHIPARRLRRQNIHV